MIAIHQYPLPVGIFYGNPHPIAVRICSQQNISIQFFGFSYTHTHRLTLFRIGVNYRWEITIRSGLFGYYVNIGKAISFKHLRHQCNAGTMNRCIDNFQIMLLGDHIRINAQIFNHINICIVHFLSKYGNIGFAPTPLYSINSCDGFYFGYHVFIVWWYQLRSIAPICFVTIVFLGIVRCSTYHTRLTTQMPDGKRQLRCWPKGFKKKNFQAVGSKNIGGCFSKKPAIVSTVMRYRNFYFGCSMYFSQVIGKALGSHAYRIFIHSIGTYTHYAA